MDIKSKSLAIKAYCTQITGNKLFDVIKQTVEKAEPQSNLASPCTDVFGRLSLLQISDDFIENPAKYVCYLYMLFEYFTISTCYDYWLYIPQHPILKKFGP